MNIYSKYSLLARNWCKFRLTKSLKSCDYCYQYKKNTFLNVLGRNDEHHLLRHFYCLNIKTMKKALYPIYISRYSIACNQDKIHNASVHFKCIYVIEKKNVLMLIRCTYTYVINF